MDISSITQMFNTTISSMRKYFCSKEKFPLSFDGKDDLTYVGHTRYDKEGDNASFETLNQTFQDLFYISPFYHLVFPFDKFIVLDADIEFKESPEHLYEEFERFDSEQLFGIAKDMSHNYRLLLIQHRCVFNCESSSSTIYNEICLWVGWDITYLWFYPTLLLPKDEK